jgi:hypothetical protein
LLMVRSQWLTLSTIIMLMMLNRQDLLRLWVSADNTPTNLEMPSFRRQQLLTLEQSGRRCREHDRCCHVRAC